MSIIRLEQVITNYKKYVFFSPPFIKIKCNKYEFKLLKKNFNSISLFFFVRRINLSLIYLRTFFFSDNKIKFYFSF